jgi:glycogen synthase
MQKLYFIPSTKINARIADTVINGYHIKVDGITFEQTSRRPFGKTLRRALINEAKQERILIYG